jgi:hypothetical protein
MQLMEKYLSHLVLNQEDTFTKPFEIIASNLGNYPAAYCICFKQKKEIQIKNVFLFSVMGLDTVELTWDNEGKKNFEDLVIESSYDLYETTSVTKRAVRFPKYDNIVMDPRRYNKAYKAIIPLELLGLREEQGNI